jgi:iron-sulfur cluster assembly protein
MVQPPQAGDLSITARALSKLREIAQKEAINTESTFLRVAVVPGGCSGLTYELGWDTTQRETDRSVEITPLRVLLDERSWRYIRGTELDFSDGLEGQGFHFINPQAARTCACGESFGL